MKVSEIRISKNDMYIDAYVYIMPKGTKEEWRFTVSLDLEESTIYDGDVYYAEDDADNFDVAEKIPPVEVVQAFDIQRAKMVEMLNDAWEGKE